MEGHTPNPSFPFAIHKYTIRPGEFVRSHTHDFVELVYVLSGNADHEMAGVSYQLHPGDVFVIEPSIYHSYRGADNNPTVVYNVLFQVDLIQRELQSLCQFGSFINWFYLAPFLRRTARFVPYLSLDEAQALQLERQLDALLAEIKQQRPGYQLLAKTQLIGCMVYLSRLCSERGLIADASASVDERVTTVVSFLEQHYQHPISMHQLSRLCGMSASSLTTKFKRLTGLTILEFKHRLQVRAACRLLKATDDKVLTVAQTTGFDDLSFFYRVFRKQMGMTPTQYRNGTDQAAHHDIRPDNL